MPIEIDKGPGGVDAAYGKRTTLPTRNYDVTKAYGDTFREDGDGPVNHIVKEDENGNVGIGTDTPVGSLNLAGTSADPAELVFTRTDSAIGERNWYERVNAFHNFEIGRMDDLGGNPSPKVTVDKNSNMTVGGIVQAGSAVYFGNGVGKLNFSGSDSYLDSNGKLNLRVNGSTQALQIDTSGNVGAGVSPSSWGAAFRALQLPNVALWSNTAVGVGALFLSNNSYFDGANYKYLAASQAAQYDMISGVHSWKIAGAGSAGATITWSQAMTLDTAGNLGVSVIPSAWASGYKAVEFAPGGAVWGNSNGNGNFFSTNLYYDGTWKYKNNFPATYYRQAVGEHSWHVAPSGTAGNTATLTQAVTLDNNGNFLVTGGGGLGYGTGSGGTVTQLTSKSTAVVLNKVCGQIVTNSAALAAGTTVTFTLTNSKIEATDVVSVQVKGFASASGSYQAWVSDSGIGAATIALRNMSGGSLAEAVTLNFVIIKGATS